MPDLRAAIADHEARWATGATASGITSGGGLGGHLRAPFDDALVREVIMPGVREEMRRAVDERMRPLLAELKARCWYLHPQGIRLSSAVSPLMAVPTLLRAVSRLCLLFGHLVAGTCDARG